MHKLVLAAAIAAAVFAPASAQDRYGYRSYSQDGRYQNDRYQPRYQRSGYQNSGYQGRRYQSARYPSAPQALPPCDGHYATIRTSEVQPGKWAQFQSAVAAHRNWYAQHGRGATVSLARVVRSANSGGGYADGEAVTITVFRDAAARTPQHDAAWDQFVQDYKASSRVKDEKRVCLPSLS